MGSSSGIVNYDFKAARARIQYFTQLYHVGKRLCPDDEAWGRDLIVQIEELEKEIAEAHQATNAKMTTVTSSGHPVSDLKISLLRLYLLGFRRTRGRR